MKTNDLIAILATKASTPPAISLLHRSIQAVMLGLAASLALLLIVWGLAPELYSLAHTEAFWVKMLWLVLTCIFAAPVVMHLSRPGVAVGRSVWGIVASLAGITILAIWQVTSVDVDTGKQLILGQSWQVCSINIVALSAPLLMTLLWMLRSMAPTRPALAGASAGFMAGALACLVYSLHCPEIAYPFLAIWYVGGMVLMSGIGALLGVRLLRW